MQDMGAYFKLGAEKIKGKVCCYGRERARKFTIYWSLPWVPEVSRSPLHDMRKVCSYGRILVPRASNPFDI